MTDGVNVTDSRMRNDVEETVEMEPIQSIQEAVQSNAPDGGWGWVVVISTLIASCLYDGVTYSYGVLTTEFIDHYNVSRTVVGFMGSIMVGMTLAVGPLVSVLCDKYGYRIVVITGGIISSISFLIPFFSDKFWLLILTTSVLTGMGFGMVYQASVVMVNIYFDKRRGLAMGIAVCGSGIGTFVFSPIIESLIGEYSWRGSMLIIGGLLLNLIPCGILLRPLLKSKIEKNCATTENDKNDKATVNNVSLENSSEIKVNFLSKLKNCITPIFLLFAISNCLSSIGFNAPFLYAKDRAMTDGISPMKSSLLITSIGVGNCIGRLVFGYLATTRFVNRFHLYNASLIICGLSLILSWGVTKYAWMVTYTFVFGVMAGTYVTLTSIVLVDLLGLNNLNFTFGIINTCQGIFVFIGPPLAGCVYDMTKSFNIAFLFCGICLSVSGLMMFLSYLSKDFRRKSKNLRN